MRDLQDTFDQKHETLVKTTALFRETLEIAQAHGWKTHANLWNIGIYVNMASHDLSVLVQQVYFDRNSWSRRLTGRHLAMLIYETVQDLLRLLGKQLRAPLIRLGLLKQFEGDIASVRETVHAFDQARSGVLLSIRNRAAAHRDLDGLLFLQTIAELRTDDIAEWGKELGECLNAIGALIQRILQASSEIRPPELVQDQP